MEAAAGEAEVHDDDAASRPQPLPGPSQRRLRFGKDRVAEAEEDRIHRDVDPQLGRVLLHQLHVRPAVRVDELARLGEHARRCVHRDHGSRRADRVEQIRHVAAGAGPDLQHRHPRRQIERGGGPAPGGRKDQVQGLKRA